MLQSPLVQKLPRAVLFDYDGVLVSSEPIHLLAWMQLLEEIGIPPDESLIKRNVGKAAPQIMTEILNRYRPGWTLAEFDLQALAQRKNVLYLSFAEKGLAPYPHVIEGLQWLRSQKVATAIVSNGRRHEVLKTSKLLGLFELMDTIVCRDDVREYKPNPTPYLFAAASLEVNPLDCIAIEDSPPGLEAALMAGIPAAAVTTNFPASIVESPIPGRPDLKPFWIGPSMEEFFNYLKKLPR